VRALSGIRHHGDLHDEQDGAHDVDLRTRGCIFCGDCTPSSGVRWRCVLSLSSARC